jgi:hypothetical protein
MTADESKDFEPGAAAQARPANVPPKFWDPARGTLRTQALLQAYLDLERRLTTQPRGATPPDGPDSYRIESRHPALASDPEVNKRLHAAGFTQDQAQLLYDLAHERLLPILTADGEGGGASGGGASERDQHLSDLKSHFGGEDRWQQLAPQLAAWGRRALPSEAFEVLTATADGVKALHRLMTAQGEPSLGRSAAPRDEVPAEAQLKKMIQDPRYWKTRDPAYIAKVSDGFRRLYGEG